MIRHKWRLTPDERVEYMDTKDGFVRADWLFFATTNLQKLGTSTTQASIAMNDLQRMIEAFNEN